MSRTSKFFVFRPWVEPSHSKNTNGDKLRLLSSPEGDAAEQRNANIKLAWFFSVVALFFLVVNHLGCVKNGEDANLGTDSTRVTLTLSPPVRSGEGAGFSVRFRLSNSGNNSVFYPISRTASIPIGELSHARIAVIRVGEPIPCAETASPRGAGIYGFECRVD